MNTHSLFPNGESVASSRSMGQIFVPFARRWQRVQRQSPAQYFQHCSHLRSSDRTDAYSRIMSISKVSMNMTTNCRPVCWVSCCISRYGFTEPAEKHFAASCLYDRNVIQGDTRCSKGPILQLNTAGFFSQT